MPYFHIDITETENKQFVVNAPDRTAAENMAFVAAATDKCDHKKIVKLTASHNSSLSITETDKAAWTDTLKQAKAK